MNIIFMLVPISILLALGGLGGFWWAVRSGQFDDPTGDASRILIDDPQDAIPGKDAAKAD
jgi:cbb3-type cytochrome oxidase maturation protein